MILYTDASYDEAFGKPPKFGWVLFDPWRSMRPIAQELQLTWSFVDQWLSRKQQVFSAEAFTPPAALVNLAEHFVGRDAIVFIDNESAASTLIRGASTQDIVRAIAECFGIGRMTLDCRCWIEWIDTDSNPADPLSRAGISDEWVIGQGWSISVASLPCWANFLADPEAAWEQIRGRGAPNMCGFSDMQHSLR